MKRFNITGTCYADKHYMVNIDDRVQQIKKMVDRGDYFCINRGRQYGKTTTLHFLKKALDSEYTVFSISFEGGTDEDFSSIKNVTKKMFSSFTRAVKYNQVKNLSDSAKNFLTQDICLSDNSDFISDSISEFCQLCNNPVVLIIDEVDQAGNYEAFVKFLGLLRDKYLNREDMPTFHSVILAGVYDVKNLKLKMRPDEQHQYNSPWNIAAPFEISMELDEPGIKKMLDDYETDHHTGMDTARMARFIWDYTSGYPFLVSRLCMIIDEKLNADWTDNGFLNAVKNLLNEQNTLFDDMRKKLDDFKEMRHMLSLMLYDGQTFAFSTYDKAMNIAKMFNFIKEVDGKVAVSNRIFETWFYSLFHSEAQTSVESKSSEIISDGSINQL